MTTTPHIESFELVPGRVVAGKYAVESRLGGGWEGEVYKVREVRTDVPRAAKLLFPHRRESEAAIRRHAQKLEKLRQCPMVIHYHHAEFIRLRGERVTCLISQYVDGELLSDFVARQPGKRLQPFAALHLIHALVRGLEEIHDLREYHGDLHEANVIVKRHGIFFELKLLDFYHWGRPTSGHLQQDIADVIRLLYDAVGGRTRYASQPPEIKAICRGLRRDLLARSFPTVRHLREHLERFDWNRT